jgi:hypothetical protein
MLQFNIIGYRAVGANGLERLAFAGRAPSATPTAIQKFAQLSKVSAFNGNILFVFRPTPFVIMEYFNGNL